MLVRLQGFSIWHSQETRCPVSASKLHYSGSHDLSALFSANTPELTLEWEFCCRCIRWDWALQLCVLIGCGFLEQRLYVAKRSFP